MCKTGQRSGEFDSVKYHASRLEPTRYRVGCYVNFTLLLDASAGVVGDRARLVAGPGPTFSRTLVPHGCGSTRWFSRMMF